LLTEILLSLNRSFFCAQCISTTFNQRPKQLEFVSDAIIFCFLNLHNSFSIKQFKRMIEMILVPLWGACFVFEGFDCRDSRPTNWTDGRFHYFPDKARKLSQMHQMKS
jgi:hypothetical protein